MKRRIAFLCSTIICFISNAQYFGECGVGIHQDTLEQPPVIQLADCSNSSSTYLNDYRTPGFWIPDGDTPLKTILVNIIVCQKDDGTGGWIDTPALWAQAELMMEKVNERYGSPQPKGYTLTCEPNINYISDTRIRFKLNNIYFIPNTDFHYNYTSPATPWDIIDYLHVTYPETKYQLNHIFSMIPPGSNGPDHWGYYEQYTSAQAPFVHTYKSMFSPEYMVWPDHISHFAHEYGHAVGLHHTYNGEILNMSHYDYLNDVFGDCGEPSCCTPPPGYSCYLTTPCFWSWQTPPFVLMCGAGTPTYISPKQAGRMNRDLSLYGNEFVIQNRYMHKFVEEITPSNQDYVVVNDETWDFKIKMYQNVVIKSGATLTITCEVMMPNNGKIIVEPGGKLVVDGGKITNYYYLDAARIGFWSGIEVWGNSNLSQAPAYQGYLITKNNAIIENAKEAVRVWEPGNWNSTGGILLCSNTTFKNNWRSVEFIRYHSYHPANQNIELVNKGRFTNCLFTWDDNFIDGSAAPAPAMTMYHVYGVQVRGCDFIDDRTIANLQRTTGIYTIDAGYRVIGQYTGGGIFYPTSFPQDEYYSETDYNVSHFKNLKAGVHAMNATTLYNVMVDHSKFENDSYGIIIDGVDDAILTRNKFDFNSSHPSDISSMYQLSSRESSAYTVEGNLFYRTDPFGAAGTYIKNSGPDNNQVYDNYYEGLNVGNWADGFNSNDQSSLEFGSGLQWICNKNEQGYIDFLDYVSVYDPSLNGEGVRLLQGSLYEAAGNTFSSNITLGVPVSDAHIYQLDQDFMAYYYYPGTDKFPAVITGSAGAVLADENNSCLSNFTNNLVVAENILINSAIKPAMQTRLDDIDQELITKNQELDSLLSSGDTQTLHQLIEDLTYQNRQQTKDALLQASPYLSQSLLEELGLQQPSLFPHSWYKEIIEANIEVARHNSFMESLLTKPFPMPSGMYQAINDDRYSTFTVRGYKEMDILELNKEREVIMNLFIADELADSTSVDWLAVKQILMERDHIECKRQVADYHLSREEIPNCNNMLDLIELQLATYDMERVQQELQDFVDFKRYLLTITDNTGIIKQLHQSEIQQLDYMATNFEGKAARQARNILCFFEGMCEEIDLVIPEAGQNNNRTMSPEDQPIFNDMLKLKIVPNPNEGTFKLIVPEECSISELTVVDINGKVIQHELIETEDNSIRIRLLDASAGVHLLSVSCIDGSIFTNRVLVNK